MTMLEQQLHSQLDDPGVERRTDDPEVRVAQRIARRTEVGMVQGIEKFGPELVGNPLGDVRVLGDRNIDIGESWRPDIGKRARGIAESEERGLRENGGVEPAVETRSGGAAQSGALTVVIRSRTAPKRVRLVHRCGYAQRETALHAEDAIHLPSAGNQAQRTFNRAQQRFAFPDGKLPCAA